MSLPHAHAHCKRHAPHMYACSLEGLWADLTQAAVVCNEGQDVRNTLCVILLSLGHSIQEHCHTRIPPEALPRLLLTHCSPHHHRQGLGACDCRQPGSPCASRSSSSRLCTASHCICRHLDGCSGAWGDDLVAVSVKWLGHALVTAAAGCHNSCWFQRRQWWR